MFRGWPLLVLVALSPGAWGGADDSLPRRALSTPREEEIPASSPGGGTVLRTRVPWQGRYVPGAETELGLELSSDRGGAFRLRARSGDFRLELDDRLVPDRSRVFHLPIRPGPQGDLELSLSRPGEPELRRHLRLVPWTGPGLQAGPDLDPRHLPGHLAGYQSLALLRLYVRDLPALSAAQMAALEDYLLACGRLTLDGASGHWIDALRSLAACARPPAGLPGERAAGPVPVSRMTPALAEWREGPPRPVLWLAAAFALYVSAMTLLVRLLPPWPLVGLAVLLTLGLVLGLARLTPQVEARGLLVARAGAPLARLELRLDVEAYGAAETWMALPAGTRLVRSPGRPLRLRLEAGRWWVRPAVSPLARTRIRVLGSRRLRSRPGFRVDAAGRPGFRNEGSGSLAAGLARVGGHWYRTPALAPGEAWWPRHAAAPLDAGLPAALLRGSPAPVWILPLPAAERAGLPPLGEGRAWLLVYAQ